MRSHNPASATAPTEISAVLTFKKLDEQLAAPYRASDREASWMENPVYPALLYVVSSLFILSVAYVDVSEHARHSVTYFMLGVDVAAFFWLIVGQIFSVRNAVKSSKSVPDELDEYLLYCERVRQWILRHPTDSIHRLASAAGLKKEQLTRNLPLFTGNIANLGYLPVVATLYLQIRDFSMGKHLGVVDVSFGIAIMVIYCLCILACFRKARVEAYDSHLQDALAEATKRDDLSASST